MLDGQREYGGAVETETYEALNSRARCTGRQAIDLRALEIDRPELGGLLAIHEVAKSSILQDFKIDAERASRTIPSVAEALEEIGYAIFEKETPLRLGSVILSPPSRPIPRHTDFSIGVYIRQLSQAR